jgi:hypothetical protein
MHVLHRSVELALHSCPSLAVGVGPKLAELGSTVLHHKIDHLHQLNDRFAAKQTFDLSQ